MNRANAPVLSDPMDAVAAVDRDLVQVLRARGATSIEELGWTRPSPLTLLIPVVAVQGSVEDHFLVELSFAYYPEWPPKVRFVNPETQDLQVPADLYWVPKLVGSQAIATHESYSGGGYTFPGFVCFSFNVDFYLVEHSLGDPQHHWKARSRNFNATLSVLEDALRRVYQGRMRNAS